MRRSRRNYASDDELIIAGAAVMHDEPTGEAGAQAATAAERSPSERKRKLYVLAVDCAIAAGAAGGSPSTAPSGKIS
jgi:hypothetical protein